MEILTGPACSGKTSLLLEQYRRAVRTAQSERRLGRTLWLGPTHRVCEQVRRQLWSGDLPVVLSPQVLTFDDFADRILQFSTDVMRPLPPVMQRLLVRHVIDAFQHAGELKYFSSIAESSGFLDVVLGLISELKREEIWPEEFQEACARRGASRADQELGLIYAAYQDRLVQQQRYDAEGRFWSARDRLGQGNWRPFGEFDLVVVDGFSDFTHTQYEILGLLAQRSQRMVVSLPWEKSESRPELFAKSRSAIQRLKAVDAGSHVADAASVSEIPGSSKNPESKSRCLKETGLADAGSIRHGLGSLSQIASTLFANPREIVPSSETTGIEILATTGQQGEVRAIAERVKRLLVSGVAARDIVVAFRPVRDYAALVREVFSSAGIPFQCAEAEPLIQQPVVKALLAVMQLEWDDWPFEQLMGLLNSGWFRPRWNDWWSAQTPRAIADVLRDARVPQGRTAVLHACQAAVPAIVATDPVDPVHAARHQRLAKAYSCILHLDAALQPLRQSLNARDWATSLMAISQDLGIVPVLELDGEAAVKTWKSLQEALFLAAGTAEMLGAADRKLDLGDLFTELSDLLRHQVLSSPQRLAGVVEVVNAEQVRGLDVPYLFLGGLSESSFPQRGGDSCLYSEADRQELNANGLTLGHRTAQTQAEMLLFYSIVTRARCQLTLSYPAVSLDGQSLLPSPYLTTLRELFDSARLKVTRIVQLDPVPDVESMLSLSDLRVVATSETLHKRPRWFQSLVSVPTGWNAARSILAAIDMSIERFQTRGFTGYEGVITNPANLEYLRDRFSTTREFSATQLEGYATCPFRFLISDVLKIREVTAPDQFTDYGRRGTLLHEILLQLHSQLVPTGPEVPIEQAVELFRQLLAERLKDQAASTELLTALGLIEQRLLEEWGLEYAQQWSNYFVSIKKAVGTVLKPKLFELSFGTPHVDAATEASSAAPTTPCLTLGTGENQTRIRGRIDRIDVGEVSGQPVFSIIDYKTGRKPVTSAKQLQSGRSLQLVLYALATQRLNLTGQNAIPIQAGYWVVRETGWTPISKPPKFGPDGAEPHADWLALVELLDDLVPRLAAGIRSGQFPVYNSDADCKQYCPYRTACRVSQIRPLEESLAKQWEP